MLEASKAHQQNDEEKITIKVVRKKNIVARRLQKQDIDKVDTNNINEKNFVSRRRISVRRRRIKDD